MTKICIVANIRELKKKLSSARIICLFVQLLFIVVVLRTSDSIIFL